MQASRLETIFVGNIRKLDCLTILSDIADGALHLFATDATFQHMDAVSGLVFIRVRTVRVYVALRFHNWNVNRAELVLDRSLLELIDGRQ